MAARKATSRSRRAAAKRVRRTYAAMFMDCLKSLSDNGQQLVPNQTLREELGWDEDKYSRIKRQLIETDNVIVGRGKGGTVGLSANRDGRALSVFISYSHADEQLKTALLKHLKPLERQGLIDTWHDRKLVAGDTWGQEISKNLDQADIVLLLVSIDFINSQYCYDIELERALERHDKSECRVIPVILRDCLWHQTAFASIQAAPKDGKAIATWPNEDEALTAVALDVRKACESIKASR